jgi:hypothetical protein
MLLSGQRRPGITVIRKLCKAYPSQQERIMGIFLPENNNYEARRVMAMAGQRVPGEDNYAA